MAGKRSVDDIAIEKAAGQLRSALEGLGWARDDRELAGTPDRVARLWTELFRGWREEAPALATVAAGEVPAGLVALYGVRFYSLCGHHLLPFYGRAHLAYWPGPRIAGLGDLARVVEHFASRPTFQERMAVDIVHHVERELSPRGVGIVIRGRHFCLEMRGERQRSRFECSSYSGVLEDPAIRAEFVAGTRPPRPAKS